MRVTDLGGGLKMADRELNVLEDPDEWNSERAEERPPSASARAVVSVAFNGDDFDRVSDAARRAGMKTSEFIRAAALERSSGHDWRAPVSGVGRRAGS